jgi:RNA polymerase sigma-70 factor (ECF subfamily)
MIDQVELEFDKIHADFRPQVQRYLTRMVGEHEAEDLTQEVFVKISRGLGTFRGESQLSTWIYRIATNAALDRLRNPASKRIAPEGLPAGADAAEGEERGREIAAAAPSLDQQICRKERYECYRDFIQDLPANYRTVVALSELEELAASEIAEILGLSLDVVKIRLHRGRTRLLSALKSHCKPEDWL